MRGLLVLALLAIATPAAAEHYSGDTGGSRTNEGRRADAGGSARTRSGATGSRPVVGCPRCPKAYPDGTTDLSRTSGTTGSFGRGPGYGPPGGGMTYGDTGR